jgi:hypothetical protein
VTDIEYTIDGTKLTWDKIQQTLAEMPPDGSRKVVFTATKVETGKWGMAQLWRVWMSITGEWMAGRGAKQPLLVRPDGTWLGERPFDKNDAHELFTHKWLGADKEGKRLSWSKDGRDGMRPADKGERFMALLKHEEWATEKGILLFKPKDSEYAKLEREQDGQCS